MELIIDNIAQFGEHYHERFIYFNSSLMVLSLL